MKQAKRLMALLLCLVMTVGLIPSALAAGDTPVQTDNATAEWDEIQSIISQYYGEWKDTTYPGKVNNRIPNTALLGNGDVGVSSAGNDTTKTFMISKSDFWEYNGNPANSGYGSPLLIGTYSISEGVVEPAEEEEDKGENLAPSYKEVTCSSEYIKEATGDYYPASAAVDGKININPKGDGWVSMNKAIGTEHWIALEFEEAITFQRFVLYNDGYARSDYAFNNSKDFWVQVKDSAEDEWDTVHTVNGNTDNVCDVSLDAPVTAKFVRLVIKAHGDRARAVEFELYRKPAQGENLALSYKNVTASSHHDDFTPDRAVNGLWEDTTGSYEGWVTSVGNTHWLQLEFDAPITFDHWIVKNDGAARSGQSNNNTKDCEVQISDDGSEWETVSSVTGNSADIIDVMMGEPSTAKFVRLYITGCVQGGSNPRARVGQFELYLGAAPGSDEEEEVVETNPDVIKGATAYTCGAYTDGGKTWSGSYMVDGLVDSNKWCCVPGNGGHDDKNVTTHYAIFDMGEAKTFGYYKLTNAGLVENNHNTRSYQLQYLETTANMTGDALKASEDWKTILEVKGSNSTYNFDSFDPVTARYVRLYLTEADQPNQNNAARIHELELYATDPTPYFRERENILDAQVETDMTFGDQLVSMKTWMAATDNVMVTELTGKGTQAVNLKLDLAGSAANVSLRPVTAQANDDGSITVTRTTALNSSNMPQTNSDAVYNTEFVKSIPYQSQAAVTTKVVGVESTSGVSGTTATLGFTLEPGKTVYLVTAIGGGGQTYDADGNLWTGRTEPVDEAAALLAKYKTESDLEALHAAHLNWWKDYWMQSYISLDTSNADLATIQKYYYAAQYMLGSAIREGNVASGLYSIWHTNDSPSWHSDFHLNYNFIATYYGMATSNRVSMLLPAAKALTDYIPQGKANAASIQQLRVVDNRNLLLNRLIELGQVDPEKGIENAILFPVSIGPYSMTLENNSYHNETVNAPYSIYPLIEYYNYTLDENFLRNSLYPYLELVNNFAAHWLVEDEPGKYNLYAGYNEGSWAINPAVELSAYKNCLRYGVKLSKQLGDDNWKTWEPILNGLADQPTVENYNGTGKTVLALAEKQWNGSAYVDMTTPVPGDGNCIPLDALLPGEVFGYYSSNETLQILQDTVKIFDDRGGWTQINNFPRLATDAVNCRYSAERVVEQLAAGIRRQMKANMMIDDGVHGIEKAGATEAVNNMMLLSDQGVIKLFGNWLANTDAKFVRLRANGAFVFSAEYDGETNEVVEGVTMYSEAGATATVASLWDEGMTVLDSHGNRVAAIKGTAPNHEEEITYTFDTVKGETYTFVKHTSLDDAKDAAIDELEDYKDKLGELTEEEEALIDEIIADAAEAIEDAETEEEIAKIVEDAKAAMDQVLADSALAKAKQDAIDELEGYKDSLGELTEEEEALIDEILADAQAAIEDAETEEEIAKIVEDAKAAMDQALVDYALAKAKQDAIDELEGYKDFDDYYEPQQDELREILNRAKEAIRNAESQQEINRIVSDAKKELDDVYTKRDVDCDTLLGIIIGSAGNGKSFIDVSRGDWFYDAVQYVVNKGLMNGTSDNTFSPNAQTTRAMVVTILYRDAGSPSVESDGAAWWSDARAWAMAEGISDGTNMDGNVTREQLAALLYRYLQYRGRDVSERGDLSAFADGGQVSSWAREAMEWATGSGVITGKDGGRLDPQGNATRAEIATMLMRMPK